MSATETGAIEYRRLSAVSELDQLIFGSTDPFALATADEERFRTGAIAAAVAHHAEREPRYAALLRATELQPEDLRTAADLDRVPQLPTSVFKRTPRVFHPEPGARESRSSGTQGTLSVVWRDRTTIERLLGSVRAGIRLMDDWHEDEVQVLNLGPDRGEAEGLWFAYVMSLLELVFPTTHCVRDGALDRQWALGRLQAALDSSEQVGVVGPPALVADLAHSAAEAGASIDGSRLTVVTAGGWKRAGGEAMKREELDDLVATAFRIEDRTQLRDAFNQVELNTVMFECEARCKHVPPWVHVTVREPTRLAPCPPGEIGLLSYLDASAVSFPCFIVADDVGRLDPGPCACGRPGRTIEVLRRLRRDESWGCALKMDRDTGR